MLKYIVVAALLTTSTAAQAWGVFAERQATAAVSAAPVARVEAPRAEPPAAAPPAKYNVAKYTDTKAYERKQPEARGDYKPERRRAGQEGRYAQDDSLLGKAKRLIDRAPMRHPMMMMRGGLGGGLMSRFGGRW